jgi:hypothetical protein
MWNRLTTENVQEVFAITLVVCALALLSAVIPA